MPYALGYVLCYALDQHANILGMPYVVGIGRVTVTSVCGGGGREMLLSGLFNFFSFFNFQIIVLKLTSACIISRFWI